MQKRVIWICVPSYDGRFTGPLVHAMENAAELTHDPDHPFEYVTFKPVGLREVDFARNFCVMQALKDPRMERLQFWDADMNPPPNWWALFGAYKADIVSGLACGWIGYRELEKRVPQICTVMYHKDLRTGKYLTANVPGPGTFQVDAVGAGCMNISRSLLERVRDEIGLPWFKTVKREEDQAIEEGEDMYFCRKANALGVRVTVDPRIEFGHDKVCDTMDISRFVGAVLARGIEGLETKEDVA
jgi:hypothetical protein